MHVLAIPQNHEIVKKFIFILGIAQNKIARYDLATN